MGAGNFSVKEYQVQAQEAKVSTNSGFQASAMHDEFNPAKVSVRHSKRSPFNEFKQPITVLIGLDVTGSMDIIPKALLTGKLGSLLLDLKQTFNRPNENLQISFAGIGDAKTDQAPLQVTHFESDNRFAQQLQKIWLEGGGGGNGGESYNLLWWYAANKTHLNYVQHDKRKGILITIGDDNVHSELTAGEVQMWLDPNYEGGNISNQVLLSSVREQYEVYHIVVTDGSAYRYDHITRTNKSEKQKSEEAKRWEDLLGPHNVIQTKSNNVHLEIAKIVKQHRPMQKENTEHLIEEEWRKQNIDNLTDTQWQEVLSYTLCPLTRQFMKHPVVWGDNKRAYEKAAAIDYVNTHQEDPITHETLKPLAFIPKPNLNIAQLCLDYAPYFNKLSEQRKTSLIKATLSGLPLTEQEKRLPRSSSFESLGLFKLEEKSSPVEKPKEETEARKDDFNLTCPITGEIMKKPVILIETGQTYEESALVQWFEKSKPGPFRCPKNNTELKDTRYIPNYALQGLCEEYHARLNSLKPNAFALN